MRAFSLHMPDNFSYYDILNISKNATQDEIERAYKLTKNALSENSIAIYSLFDAKESKLLIKNIEEAYMVLSSPEAKRRYDQEVLGTFQEKATKEIARSFASEVSKDYKSIIEPDENQDDTLVSDLTAITKQKPSFIDSSSDKSIQSINSLISDKKLLTENIEKEITSQKDFSGDFLKRIREARKISLGDIAKVTKINPDYLYAIENFDIAKLPPRVYLAGFLRQYCKIIGLDFNRVVPSFLRLIEDSKKG